MKPFEHPHDKRPCVVCGAAPLVLRESIVSDVGSCLRCRAPYQFREDDAPHSEILPELRFLEPKLVEVAKAAWAESIKIEFGPFSARTTTHPTDFEVFCERHQVADPRPDGELLDAEIPVEVWTVSGDGPDARWIRILPLVEPGQLDASTEWGTISLEAGGALPHGTTVTIVRPIS